MIRRGLAFVKNLWGKCHIIAFIGISALRWKNRFGKSSGDLSGAGTIINIADCNVRRVYRNYLPYLVSKAGMVTLTEALALELAPEVLVNAIAPGTVLPPDGADPAFREQAVRRSPLHLPGSPDDVAYMVGHLAAHGGFITGTVDHGGRRGYDTVKLLTQRQRHKGTKKSKSKKGNLVQTDFPGSDF